MSEHAGGSPLDTHPGEKLSPWNMRIDYQKFFGTW